jgi:threonine dehydratase
MAITSLTLSLVEEAAEFLRGRILATPLEESPELSRIAGVPVWLKLENLQKTGSFKIRGALFQLARLSEDERKLGVVTCSAGNHGKAVAEAARQSGVRATVCVPKSVDASKLRGITDRGAEVRISEFRGFDETEDWAIDLAKRQGKPFLSSFDDVGVMAGNGGTLAGEVLGEIPEARSFLLPVGGGGLSAGFSFVAKERDPGSIVVGCQHEGSPGLLLSLEAGRAVTRLPPVETAAGGIEGGLGKLPFEVLRSRVGRVELLSELELFEAVAWMLENHQYVIEPSAAAAIAAVLTGKAGTLPGPAVILVTGRNVAASTYRDILKDRV